MRNGLLRLACLVALLGCSQAFAASLGISPVGLDLPASQKAASVSLINQAGSPLNVQVRVFRWRQVDGKDELSPTQDVIASPPATTIPPGQTYLVRVARLSPAPVVAEESYRLIIDEIPAAPDERAVSEGVSMVLRTSLPVFFNRPDAVPDVQWRAYPQGDRLVVEAANHGKRYVKLMDLAAKSGRNTVSFGAGLTGYVLPGAVRTFSAPLPAGSSSALADGGVLTLTGQAGTTKLEEDVRVTAK